MRFMDAGPRRVDGIDCFVSRSGYTGEDGFEISVPAEHAEALAETLLGEQRRAADRARRARQPAARSRALPLRPRHRHHDDAGRGRAGMVDPEEPPPRRRARRRISRRRARFSPQLEQGALAPPRRLAGRKAARRCAKARRCSPMRPRPSRSARSPRAASARASMRRSRWAICRRRTPPPAQLVFAEVRGQRLPLRVAPMPFVPNTYKR